MVALAKEKNNLFFQERAKWQLSVVVPRMAIDAVECSFEDDALSSSSFEVTPDGTIWRVALLYVEKPDETVISERLKRIADAFELEPLEAFVAAVEDKDWVSEVQAGFPLMEVGSFLIVGSHHENVQIHSAVTPIYLDAGAAFGTGEHATTSGCLMAFDWVMKKRRDKQVMRCLDMGCGSGLLGMAAAKKYHIPVTAVDIDKISVDVTRENAEHNRIGRLMQCVHGDGYLDKHVTGEYTLIFSNILARPLVQFASDLAEHLAPSGMAILSGLLERQERMVLAAHKAQGLSLKHRIRVDGWSILVVGW